MRRVDDALVLPAAPGMSAGRREPDSEAVGQLPELRSPFGHSLGRFGEVRATSRLDLDLRRDQLADEVLVELRSRRPSLQLLEPIRQLERVRIEQRELFLHGDREVTSVLESIACRADLLLGSMSLLVTHFTSVNEAIPPNRGRSARAAVQRRSSSSSAGRLLAAPRPPVPRALQGSEPAARRPSPRG